MVTKAASGLRKASAILPQMRCFALLFVAATLSAQTVPSQNAGRKALTDQLNALAAKETAARRGTIAGIHTRVQAEARQREVHARLITLLGGPLPAPTPLNPRITGASDHEGIHIERILFDSQPNFPVTALLYLPPSGSSKLPAILMAPGHSPSGKAGDAAFALAFAHAGFAVLSYDPIGQGERLQYPDPANPGHTLLKGPTGEHGEAGLQPTLIGDAVSRYFLIDATRAVDYLLTRPEIDAHRIGAFGCSGGGLMTALTAALDSRIAVAGVACFTTSFDELLPSIGPQDSEQSIPNFIASGLDFPDWSELFAPKPYAIIATTEDMFPFVGAQSTEKEVRSFYSLFHASDNLAFITGPGHHGNLRPILPEILSFFTTHLQPTPNLSPTDTPPASLPIADTQVTPTGQVSTSYPHTETIFTVNLKRATEKLAARNSRLETHTQNSSPTLPELQKAIREVTHATESRLAPTSYATGLPDPEAIRHQLLLHMASGIDLPAEFYRPTTPGRHPAVLRLVTTLDNDSDRQAEIASATSLARRGIAVLLFAPRPSPPGIEETKSPVLGTFYLTELRAELVGKTLLGLRIEDIEQALQFLREGETVDPNNITAEASGHLALVLLHAAVLDSRLKHITLNQLPPTYTDYLHQPIPHDAPQDILPGVLLYYDTPDLLRILGSKVTITQQLPQSRPSPLLPNGETSDLSKDALQFPNLLILSPQSP